MSLSGVCEQARRAATDRRLRDAAAFHRTCRITRCGCPCHRPAPKPDLDETLKAERLRRLADVGVDPIPPSRGTADQCRRGHPRTSENTGKRGECLTCRRQRRDPA